MSKDERTVEKLTRARELAATIAADSDVQRSAVASEVQELVAELELFD